MENAYLGILWPDPEANILIRFLFIPPFAIYTSTMTSATPKPERNQHQLKHISLERHLD